MKTIVILLGLIGILTLVSCNDSKNKTGGEYNIDNPANIDNPQGT
ncbi:MAG: hypothetical protein PHY85_09190 [Bacteroidales bacterium]|nr:hypothetical protein [Bacteroidales bacterium]